MSEETTLTTISSQQFTTLTINDKYIVEGTTHLHSDDEEDDKTLFCAKQDETDLDQDIDYDDMMSKSMDGRPHSFILQNINNNNISKSNGNLAAIASGGGRERKNSRKETLRRKFSGNSLVSFVNTLCKGNSSKLALTNTDRVENGNNTRVMHEDTSATINHVATPILKPRKSSRASSTRIRKKSIIGKDDNRDYSLHLAAVNGDMELVRKLIGQGHCLQTEDNVRRTPLEYAVLGGNFDCAMLLIEYGADIAKIRNGIH